MRLYDELAHWWPILSPRDEYAGEAPLYLDLLRSALEGQPLRSLLELGSGGGHLASHYPPDLEVVLTDISEPMLATSRAINPDREHLRHDMRTMRLDRTFDAVILHDAVMYLTSERDLRAAFATAFAHLRPGGAFVVLPDVVREDWSEGVDVGGGDLPDGRSARMLEWQWDPDPEDHLIRVDFALMMRTAEGRVDTVHDTHEMAVWPRATFWKHLRKVGFEPVEPDVLTAVAAGEVFLTRKP